MSKFHIAFEDFRFLKKPLKKSEIPSMLFRFSGPCGLHELSLGKMQTLAPHHLVNVFLFKDRYEFVNAGVESFGIFAVLNSDYFDTICLDDETLRQLNYSPTDKGRIFLGANKVVEECVDFIWMPSSTYKKKSLWSRIDAFELNEITASSQYANERSEAFDHVHQYMEEVAQIEKKLGVQKTPWYLTSKHKRLQLLKQSGIQSHWTKK